MSDPRLHFPATARNRVPILVGMDGWLSTGARVLELASGSGEHGVYFAQMRPDLLWQPSDPDPVNRASIVAHGTDAGLRNLAAPIALDAARAEDWPAGPYDALFCANMIHIAPWEACLGLLGGAGRVLAEGGALILYGPYRRGDVPTAPSNEAFDAELKARDPGWGLRDLETVGAVADGHGLHLSDLRELPANNLLLRFLKG